MVNSSLHFVDVNTAQSPGKYFIAQAEENKRLYDNIEVTLKKQQKINQRSWKKPKKDAE